MPEKGIYIEFGPAQSSGVEVLDKLHSYLVFRDGKGNARVIRGGPPGEGIETLKAGGGGDIDVQADIPLQRSKDKYGPDDTPQSRHARKLDLGGREPEEVWKGMVERAKAINGAEIDYDIWTQNSNSVTRAALEAGGLDPQNSIPPRIDKDRLTGFDNDLSKPQDIIDRMFDEKDDQPLDDPNLASREGGETKEKRAAISGAGGDTTLTGGAGADDLAKLSPEARKFLDDVARPGSPADEILLKPVSRWTDDELGVVMGVRLDLPSGHPERNRMADKETEFFKRFHGAGAAVPIPKDPTPARTPVGALKRTLNDLGRTHFGRDAWRPLDDNEGRIGPETTTAFAKVLRAAGPKLLTERYGRFLGIL